MPGPPGSRLPSSAKSLRQATVAELDEDLYGLWLPRQLLFNTEALFTGTGATTLAHFRLHRESYTCSQCHLDYHVSR